MNIKSADFSLNLSRTLHIAITMDHLPFVKFPSHFLWAKYFTSIYHCWPYVTHKNSPYQFVRKSLAIQQLTALPTRNPPSSCSGSHSSLTSSTGTHPVTKICEFAYSFQLPYYHTAHTHTHTHTNRESQPMLSSFRPHCTLRQAILCEAAADHCPAFPKVNLPTLALKIFLPFYELISGSLDCLTHQD